MYKVNPAAGRVLVGPQPGGYGPGSVRRKIAGECFGVINFERDVFPILAPALRQVVSRLDPRLLAAAEELRIRVGKPLLIRTGDVDLAVTPQGQANPGLVCGYLASQDDVWKTVHLMSQYSVYALEEELRHGYITVPGGHRVGLVGKAVLDEGRVRTLKYIAGINFRLAREIHGAADPVMPFIVKPPDRVLHTLIISPPRCGKTTLLRDIVRQVSDGVPHLDFAGVAVGVVDERSEIAGCVAGVPQNDIGVRTDVLDACPKVEGMGMLIRGMSPRVIATDEIGHADDVRALEEALRAGVSLITTVHGSSLDEIKQRPALRRVLQLRVFERFITLGRSRGVGTVEAIIDGGTETEVDRRGRGTQ